MNNNINLYRKIEIEDFIWIINLFIVIFALISNHYEKDYLKNHDRFSEKIYKTINIDILIVVFVIYSYFLYSRYQVCKELKNTSSKQEVLNANLNFLAALFVVIAALIYIYTEITSSNLKNDDLSLI